MVTKKQLCALVVGNIAVLSQVFYRLAKIQNGKPLTIKDFVYGYIAVSGSLSSMIGGYIQFAAFTNIPVNFPKWILNKYFPYSIDPNVEQPSKKFDKKVFYHRLYYFSLFAIHHSLFARKEVKDMLNNYSIIPQRIERSIYTIGANYLMYLLMKNWNSCYARNSNSKKSHYSDAVSIRDDDDVDIESGNQIRTTSGDEHDINIDSNNKNKNKNKDVGYIWQIPKFCQMNWVIRYLPFVIFLVLGAKSVSSVVNEEEFVGITQAFNVNDGENVNAIATPAKELIVKGFYTMVRHPQMFFNIMAFLSVSKMSLSRLTLTAFFGVYVLFGVQLEEKGLIQEFGNQYINYQKQVPQLLPTWPLFKNVQL